MCCTFLGSEEDNQSDQPPLSEEPGWGELLQPGAGEQEGNRGITVEAYTHLH